MLLFSQRKKLALLYEDWCREEGVAITPQTVIDFLTLQGLICEEKAKEFINKGKEKEVSNENT